MDADDVSSVLVGARGVLTAENMNLQVGLGAFGRVRGRECGKGGGAGSQCKH